MSTEKVSENRVGYLPQMCDVLTYVRWDTPNPFYSPIDMKSGKITIGEMVKDLPDGAICVGHVRGKWEDYFMNRKTKVVIILGQGFDSREGDEIGTQNAE